MSHILVSLFLSYSHAQVVSFFPQGYVSQVQQIKIQFAKDMVVLNGTPTAPLFEGECSGGQGRLPEGSGRWLNPRSWVYNFKNPVPRGMECRIQVSQNLKTLEGVSVSTKEVYRFSTGGPRVVSKAPEYYNKIEPLQYFVLLTDGPLDTDSVLKGGLYFQVEGLLDKIKVQRIPSPERELVLKTVVQENWSFSDYKKAWENISTQKLAKVNTENFLVVRAERPFPEGAKVKMVWSRLLRARQGQAVVDEEVFEYQVMEKFVARMNCERASANSPCNPLLPVNLNFSSPVKNRKIFEKIVVRDQKTGQVWLPDWMKNKKKGQSPPQSAVDFSGPFPPLAQLIMEIPKDITDELGRKLTNANKFPLPFGTDDYSPLLKVSARFGLIEAEPEGVLPVHARQLESSIFFQSVLISPASIHAGKSESLSSVIKWLSRLENYDEYESRSASVFSNKDPLEKGVIPKPLGAKEFEVFGVPLKKKGFHVHEFQSPILGSHLLEKGKIFYVPVASLNTNIGVHLKLGYDNALVWVTQLSNAKPIEKATVRLVNRRGTVLMMGLTDKNGVVRFKDRPNGCVEIRPQDRRCEREETSTRECEEEPANYQTRSCEVFAFVSTKDDFSFVSSRWNSGIENYRFNSPNLDVDGRFGAVMAHTVFDRVLAMAGEQVQMKHYLRRRSSGGFAPLKKEEFPTYVLVKHHSGKTYRVDIQWDEKTQSGVSVWSTEKDMALGYYSVELVNAKGYENLDQKLDTWESMMVGSLTLSEFRLPVVRAKVQAEKGVLINPKKVDFFLNSEFIAGGPAKNLKMSVRSQVSNSFFRPEGKDYSDFSFLDSPIKVGLQESSQEEVQQPIWEKEISLNSEGTAMVSVPVAKLTPNRFSQVDFYADYQDPNGEFRSVQTTKKVFPADFLVGVAGSAIYSTQEKVNLKGVILGADEKPKEKVKYVVEAYQVESNYVRKRIVGGFYSYDSSKRVFNRGKICEGVSGKSGTWVCQPKSLKPGRYELQVKVVDSKNRWTYARKMAYIYSDESEMWFNPDDSDRITLTLNQKTFSPGDIAKLTVPTPFAESLALITIEREGVITSFVKEIRRNQPQIEIPILPEYVPNAFVSVVLVRGRVNDPAPTGFIDLAKPSLRMGLLGFNVQPKAQVLDVQVTVPKKEFSVKSRFDLDIQITDGFGKKVMTPAEVTVAIVDEALLELSENPTWNFLEAVFSKTGLGVETSTVMSQVVGRRHFGSKAKSPGGGGGMIKGSKRENFKPIVLWGTFPLDAQGKVRIPVHLNDSISKFQVKVFATAGLQKFGTGETLFTTHQDFIITSGVPLIARVGDSIKVPFSIQNTTTMDKKVGLQLSKAGRPLENVDTVVIKAKSSLSIPYEWVIDEKIGDLTFDIRLVDVVQGVSLDAMAAKTKVIESFPERVQQTEVALLSSPREWNFAKPQEGIVGQGGVQISLKSELDFSLDRLRKNMMDYPFNCLEQQVSRAVVLNDKSLLVNIAKSLPKYQTVGGLLNFFPPSQSDTESIELTLYVMNQLFEEGIQWDKNLQSELVSVLNLLLNGDYTVHGRLCKATANCPSETLKFKIANTLSNYRSFDSKILQGINLRPNLWPTQVLIEILELGLKEKTVAEQFNLAEIEQVLTSRLLRQGSTVELQNPPGVYFDWLSSRDSDLAAIGILAQKKAEQAGWASEIPAIAMGLKMRSSLGSWDSTIADALVARFARNLSSLPAIGQSTTSKQGKTDVKATHLTGKKEVNVNWAKEKEASLQLNWDQSENWKVMMMNSSPATQSLTPWVDFQLTAAMKRSTPFWQGLEIEKKLVPIIQKKAGQWSAGDVVEVQLIVKTKNSHQWLAIRDPLPTGVTYLSSQVIGSKQSQVSNQTIGDTWPQSFSESTLTEFRSFAEEISSGTYIERYRLRLNLSGTMTIPSARVEAMYSRDLFGETGFTELRVLD